MKKVIFIGQTGSGKTTLCQKLNQERLRYRKTQAVEWVGSVIDTPGEYMQNRWFWGPLTVISYDADLIGFVHDSTNEDCWFNGGLSSKFDKPVIGIVTKVDQPDSRPSRSRNYLEFAGVKEIYETSAYDGSGIDVLSERFHRILEK